MRVIWKFNNKEGSFGNSHGTSRMGRNGLSNLVCVRVESSYSWYVFT